MRKGPWERKKSRINFWSKNGTSTFGFHAVLKLKTDEKWSQRAKKKLFLKLKTYEIGIPGSEKKILSSTTFWSKNGTSTFSFDSVLKLKTDRKWSLRADFFIEDQFLAEK